MSVATIVLNKCTNYNLDDSEDYPAMKFNIELILGNGAEMCGKECDCNKIKEGTCDRGFNSIFLGSINCLALNKKMFEEENFKRVYKKNYNKFNINDSYIGKILDSDLNYLLIENVKGVFNEICSSINLCEREKKVMLKLLTKLLPVTVVENYSFLTNYIIMTEPVGGWELSIIKETLKDMYELNLSEVKVNEIKFNYIINSEPLMKVVESEVFDVELEHELAGQELEEQTLDELVKFYLDHMKDFNDTKQKVV